MKRLAEGLTLIELLVGMALMGIILTALLSFFTQSSKTSMQSSARADLQQETLNAQQLIAGKLKEAFYIWPVNQTITLGGATASTYQNPITSNSTWTTGTHPILAMALPPVTPGGNCTSGSSGSTVGCYQFLAYYPVKRSVWVAGTSNSNNPGPDAANDDTWVLVQYKAYWYSGFDPATATTTVPTPVPSGNARLLADYIAPTDATGNTYSMFTFAPSGTTATVPVTGVTLNLAVTRNIAGKLLRLPNATDEYTISVFPTNLGKIAAN